MCGADAVVLETPITRNDRYRHPESSSGGLSVVEETPILGDKRKSAPDCKTSSSATAQTPARGIPTTNSLKDLEIATSTPRASIQNVDPSDMITPPLVHLAKTADLEQRYRPESQTRELQALERGYWLLDCSSWETEAKQDFWEFMTAYLGQEGIGWGITCRRNANSTQVRLYCWGCIVGHMYLVLWLASKRRAKYAGMKWIAGNGGVVITMPSKRQ